MQQRSITATTALLAAAALTLTACGNDSAPSGDDKIKGADDAKKPPSASATSPDDANRPEIKTPGFKMKFEGWTSEDAKEQAVLDDGRERAKSVNAAIVKGDPEAKEFTYYSNQNARRTGQQWIEGFTKEDTSLSGVSRYYDASVKFNKKGFAVLKYCLDESRTFPKNKKTGKVDKNPTTDKSYDFYNTKLERNKQGVWETVAVLAEDGGCKK